MPSGVYDRSVKVTAEQKRKRTASNRNRGRIKNREQIKASRKRYHAENREQIAERYKQYYAENQDRRQEYAKQYHIENRDGLAVKQKQYRKDHSEEISRKNAKRRAIKSKATIGDHADIVAWEKQWRSKKTVTCHWCSKRIKTADVHVDHVVPLSKGGAHSVENLCVSCETCNLSKHAKLPDVWNAGLSQPLLFV